MKANAISLNLIISLFCLGVMAPLEAAENKSTPAKPERDITAALQYPAITINPDDTISVDLIVKNRGRKDETVLIEVTQKPKDWDVEIKRYSTRVAGIFVAAGESQTLTFSARPKDKDLKKLPAGTYQFAIRAKTEDGALVRESSMKVTVLAQEAGPEKIVLDTSYPVLRGPSDDKFEFSLDVRNESDEDAVFNFKATAPKGWEVSFKPAYESKQISSLQISAHSSKSVSFEVTPPYNAKAGEYTFEVEVSSPKAKASKELKVVLTGTYALEAATPNGLLSVVTQRGKEAIVTLLVHNKGSAPQREITFTSFKPENWEVKFDPEKLTNLKPGDIKQVEVKIKPAEQALIGDYSVAVQVNGEKANDEVEFRITVKAASAWGWIGVAIIVVVIVGLAFTFKALGRR